MIIYFENRERSGLAELVGDHGWPIVELENGERTALNPRLNTIRQATVEEAAEFRRPLPRNHPTED